MALQRSDNERLFLGVCGGLSNTLGVNPLWIRLGFVIGALASGVGIVLYLGLAFFMLPPRMNRASFRDRLQSNFGMFTQIGSLFRSEWDAWVTGRGAEDIGTRIRVAVGGIVVLFGLFILLVSFDLFWWLTIGRAFALIMIVMGFGLLRAGAQVR